ncbi:MAG TPA: amidohydrolase family protein [Streptosporangiaceae bacterium]|nr:amidohydrolase family protein [Streptosporangiaceae bacterium]
MILDCHCHLIPAGMLTGAVPEAWRPRLSVNDGQRVVSFQGRRLTSVTGEFSDVAVMLEEAAAAGVSHLLVSPWILLVPVQADAPVALRICRVQNESIAQAARDSGGRVYGLGAVPLQDPGLAAAELADLVALPGMYGAEVPASVAGCYLGDDKFTPFWEAAADTGALVFVHPTTTGLGIAGLDGGYLWNSVGNPLETTIAAAQLVVNGVLERYPGLKILLAHGGGALPALRGRLRRAFAVRPEARASSARQDDQEQRCLAAPDDSLRRLYFDGLTHDSAVLADLVAFAGAGHVLLGSDRPFDMGTDRPVEEIRALGLPAADEQLLLAGNAGQLLNLTTDER